MSVFQLKDGRWVCGFRKGRDPERPNSTRRSFGRGKQAKEAAEQFNNKYLERVVSCGSRRVEFVKSKRMSVFRGKHGIEFKNSMKISKIIGHKTRPHEHYIFERVAKNIKLLKKRNDFMSEIRQMPPYCSSQKGSNIKNDVMRFREMGFDGYGRYGWNSDSRTFENMLAVSNKVIKESDFSVEL